MNKREIVPSPSILVVDDDAIIRAIIRAELEREGYQITEAADGEEAWQLCSEIAPQLVIADIMMPKMDGFALSRALRNNPFTANTPILQATALDDVHSIEMAYLAGATDFIGKPFNWTVLKHRVRYMLRSASALTRLGLQPEPLTGGKNSGPPVRSGRAEILSGIVQQLRTPLTAILGFSGIVRDGMLGPVSDRYALYASMVCGSGAHILALVDDILTLAKSETGTLELEQEDIDIARILSLPETIAGETSIKAGLPGHFALSEIAQRLAADAHFSQQILRELLGGAVTFSPPERDISLSVDLLEDGKAVIRFAGSDTALSKLPLTRNILNARGGELDVSRGPGNGTVITVSFPPDALSLARVGGQSR